MQSHQKCPLNIPLAARAGAFVPVDEFAEGCEVSSLKQSGNPRFRDISGGQGAVKRVNPLMNEPVELETRWKEARVLDLSGLKCPMPSLMTAKALRGLPESSLLAVTVTDPLAPLDLRHLCQRDGHVVLSERQNENGAQLLIRSGPRG